MKIIGCDLHTRYQQIAMLEQETGELIERRLEHKNGEARAFYAALAGPVAGGPPFTISFPIPERGCPVLAFFVLGEWRVPRTHTQREETGDIHDKSKGKSAIFLLAIGKPLKR